MGARSSNTNRVGDRSQSLNRLFNGHLANFFNSKLNEGALGPNPPGPLTATGGDVSAGVAPGNGYKYHVWTSPGTFVVSDGTADIEVLVVGGGGGAAWDASGGGGAGGLRTNNDSFPAPFRITTCLLYTSPSPRDRG